MSYNEEQVQLFLKKLQIQTTLLLAATNQKKPEMDNKYVPLFIQNPDPIGVQSLTAKVENLCTLIECCIFVMTLFCLLFLYREYNKIE